MDKIKNLFSTPKKTVCTLIGALLVIALIGAISVYAASTMAENSSIGADNALNFACADAGIDPVSAESVTSEFGHEQGQFVYKVKFTYANTEYEYWLRASDGSVVKKEMGVIKTDTISAAATNTEMDTKSDTETMAAETSKAETTTEASSASSETTAAPSKISSENNAASSKASSENNAAPSKASSENNASSGQISLEDAKDAALSDAGVSSSEATFTKAKLDYDDGIAEYDMEFYTSTHEYEYEINAATGAVISKNSEAFKKGSQGSSGGEKSYIGIDQAKSIALNHAGFSASEVTFSKAKLENDDGYTIYEIEFYKNGKEYEYTIDAYEGTILEYDVD